MALITDTRTVQVFAQGIIVCVTVTASALVTVLCYLCVLKCLFIIIIIFFLIIIIIIIIIIIKVLAYYAFNCSTIVNEAWTSLPKSSSCL